MSQKYVTRKKRIRELEKKITQLEQQVDTLTELLDSVHQMLYATRPRLARSMARDFSRIHPPEKIPIKKSPKLPQRNLPIAPRADLVIQNSGHIATPHSPPQV
jgi:23S rRNA A2030 N6-methylase RlmJ